MPFTLAHPAAVVAVARGPFVPSALVLGSMSPDLTYYVTLPLLDPTGTLLTRTHHVSSVFWLDPLIALVLLVAFHALLKRPVVALLPTAAAERAWPAAEGFVWRRATAVCWIALSLVIGAATHVGWDRLGDVVGEDRSTTVDLAGGVLGGVVLLGWVWRWWRTTPARPVPPGPGLPGRLRGLVQGALVAGAALFGTVGAVSGVRDLMASDAMDRPAIPAQFAQPVFTGRDMAELAARQFAEYAVAAVCVVLAVYAAGWHLSRLATARRTV